MIRKQSPTVAERERHGSLPSLILLHEVKSFLNANSR